MDVLPGVPLAAMQRWPVLCAALYHSTASWVYLECARAPAMAEAAFAAAVTENMLPVAVALEAAAAAAAARNKVTK